MFPAPIFLAKGQKDRGVSTMIVVLFCFNQMASFAKFPLSLRSETLYLSTALPFIRNERKYQIKLFFSAITRASDRFCASNFSKILAE